MQSALNIVNYGDSERVSKLTLASKGREKQLSGGKQVNYACAAILI